MILTEKVIIKNQAWAVVNNNKVAIILCIKDNFEYLEEQLDSIFAQDYKNFDIFLSDDSLTNEVNHILHC